MIMRTAICLMVVLAGFALLNSGCSGPERKLGRGIRNATEFARMGEMRRSVEQTALWDGADAGYTTGLVRGFNRSVARTAVGVYEIATFPIPFPKYYDPCYPYYLSPDPVYPDSHKPNLLADPIFGPDTALGFGGGDIMPFIPGSRFHIYDY